MGLASLVRRRRRGIFAGSGVGGAGASDNFNRADTTTGFGTSSSGHTWTPLGAGVGGIATNRGYAHVSGGGVFEKLAAGLADGDVSVTVAAAFTGTEFPGVGYRVVDGDNAMIGCMDATTGYLIKREGSGNTTLSSAPHGGFTNGDVVRVIYSGSAHSLRKGSTEITSTTSAFQISATDVGIHCLGATTRFDDLVAVP